MTVCECYGMMQGNYEDAINRFQKDSLIERFMLKFLKDKSYESLMNAVALGDIEGAFNAAHTLKGLAANLAFENLRLVASDLTEQLRALDKIPDPALVKALTDSYQNTVNALLMYEANKTV